MLNKLEKSRTEIGKSRGNSFKEMIMSVVVKKLRFWNQKDIDLLLVMEYKISHPASPSLVFSSLRCELYYLQHSVLERINKKYKQST